MLFTASRWWLSSRRWDQAPASSPPVKLIAPEVSEWIHLWTNDSAPGSTDPLGGNYDYGHALAEDADAWPRSTLSGRHQYETRLPSRGRTMFPDEVRVDDRHGRREGMAGTGASSDIDNGIAVAGWIHDALTVAKRRPGVGGGTKTQSSTNDGLFLSDGSGHQTPLHARNSAGSYGRATHEWPLRGAFRWTSCSLGIQGSDGTVVVVLHQQRQRSG